MTTNTDLAATDRATYVRQATNSALGNFDAELRLTRGDITRPERNGDLGAVRRSDHLAHLLDTVNAVEDALVRLAAFSEEPPDA